MKFRVISVCLAGILCLSVPVNVSASENENPQNSVSDTAVPFAKGLISRYSLSCKGGTKKVYIISDTTASSEMKEIGLKNVVIERSSDNKNWTEEKEIGNLLSESSKIHTLTDYSVSVSGGYYYRISCTHYAKEKGLFGSSQSVNNVSNSVWIN